ncbi:MAG: nucleotidyl transferase AbiEii/AbiGii toxin family protein [Acidobacteriota bacterium]|nr:nucleotidyl transferase AbiEii/AbiGii toxin family protein [Acidobacteriota bacterium]
MIRKQDILDRAAEWQLRPEVVEKDYVLGWLLAGLASLPLREHWIFKGGTSIKKCYFETYRFSEDLDFSLLPQAEYGEEGLRANLHTLGARTSELSGLEFPPDAIVLRERRNRQGQPTFEGRVGYRGPLVYPGTPKVLFDLTQHEAVVEPPADRPILHPYPDDLPEGAAVRAYSFNELLAEKTRALFERRRPRDLYDVVHLLENAPGYLDLARVRELFRRKCENKGLVPPTAALLAAAVDGDAEMRSEWSNMLAHQLPALPDLDAMLGKLPGLIGWLDLATPIALPESRLAAAPIPAREAPIVAPGIRFWGSGSPLETIRFAGSNRLLLEFDYHGRHRVTEPYSVRQAATTGNVLLYAWEMAAAHVKAFNLADMQNVRANGEVFSPRYRVEFSESGPVQINPNATRARPASTLPRLGTSRRTPARFGPRYVFECPYCQKRFTHSTNASSLRKHKRADGWGDCPGRQGYLVEVR